MAKNYSAISGALYGVAINIASATTTDLGAAGAPYLNVTGTTTITSFGTATAGTAVLLKFAAALTLTHNATTLILPGGANITTAAGDMARFVSEGSGNWRCEFYVKASGAAVVGGVTGFTSALNTSSPNATNNVSSLTASGGTTNQFFAIVPKGTGGITAAIPDSAAAGGNVRGNYSVDLQIDRNTNTQVASGAYAFLGGGRRNSALGECNGILGGYQCTTSGYYSATAGANNTVSGDVSFGIGEYLTLTGAADRSFGFNSATSAGTKTISIAAPDTAVFSNVNLWLANTNNAASELRFYEAQNTTGTFPAAGINYTAFKAGVQSADITYTLPTADASGVLTSNGSGTLSWGSASITGFTAALNTTSPNNTVNASSLTASGGTTNQDFVIAPKGTGALLAAIPAGAASGGNKRGTNATDWQTARGSAGAVASGSYSVVSGGKDNTASNTNSTVIGGEFNTASGTNSTVLGGYGNVANTDKTVAMGYYAKAGIAGGVSHAVGRFSATGDAQTSQYVLRVQTTDATVTEMMIDPGGSNVRLALPNDSTWHFEINIVARRTDANDESAGYKIQGVIDRNASAATTALVGSITKTVIAEDTAAWDVAVTADTTNGSLKLEVTGEAAKTINWVAFVRTVEVTG